MKKSKVLLKIVSKALLTAWGILMVSIVSLILGLIAAGDGEWNGLAFGIFFLWFIFWTIAMGNDWFKEDEKKR